MPSLERNYELMEEILRPGRKVANSCQGKISRNRWRSFCARFSGDPLVLLRAVIQPHLELQQIVVPNVNDFLDVAELGSITIYKGVSYNPYITQIGESLNLLDFYAYLRRSGLRGIIINASPYAVVNYHREVPTDVYSRNSAVEALRSLLQWYRDNSEVRHSTDMRGQYLEAMALQLFPQRARPIVVNADEMWRSERYRRCLQEAIEYCADCTQEGEELRICKYANYNRYDSDYQRWYSVLVVAEAIYMADVFGAKIKLGPTSENRFDGLIRSCMQGRVSDFAFIWYDRSVEKELPMTARVSFKDNEEEIREKIQGSEVLARWMSEIFGNLLPYYKGEPANECCRLVRLIGKMQAAGVHVPPLCEGGFLNAFPYGECD